MRCNIDEILSKAYKRNECEVKQKPSYTLNQETISKMRKQSSMDKRKFGFRLNKMAKLAVICCVVAITTGVTTVAYSMIKKHYNSTIEMENGQNVELSSDVQYKHISDDILKVNGSKIMQWDEVVDMLGFSLLGHGDVDNGEVLYSTHLNEDGSVAVVDLWIGNYRRYGKQSYAEDGCAYYPSYISLMIDILDVEAEEGYILPFAEGKDAMGGKELVEKYHSETLNTDVIIYKTGEGITANLIYDNVYYRLNGCNVTKEEMIEAIDELK